MKIFLSACLLFLCRCVNGQPLQQIQSLVNAEKAFAQTSKDKSTKEAFSIYMSDSGFIFQSGQPVLGKKFWQDAEIGTNLLTWEPVFADISSSSDLGYTTGPWEFRAKRDDSEPAAGGYYVSVWKKEKGEWKVALDIGISFPLSVKREKETLHFSSKSPLHTKMLDETEKKELLDKEQEFISEHGKKDGSAYAAFITTDTRIYRPGSFPFSTAEQRDKLFSETDKKFSYEVIGSMVASSGDLGYVYGKSVVATAKDGNTKTVNGNYLRIWKKNMGITGK